MILPPIIQPALRALAQLYGVGVRSRARLYERGWLRSRALPAPVISVGNLTAGGTGKTPCVAWVAQSLRDMGYAVAILSRGYRRASKGIVEVSDGARVLCTAAAAGDEPYLLARACPGVRVVVNADRHAAGEWLAQRAAVDVFLLDDGYQHIRLQRALNLALVDAAENLDEARLLPLGRWREPVAHLRRADAVIVTRAKPEIDRALLAAQLKRHTRAAVPVFYATHELAGLRQLPTDEVLPLTAFAGKPVAVLAGIARPARFVADLQRAGVRVVWRRAFADHHRYTVVEVADVVAQARGAGATAIITTEKDAANLPAELPSGLPLLAAQLAFRCEDKAALLRLAARTVASACA